MIQIKKILLLALFSIYIVTLTGCDKKEDKPYYNNCSDETATDVSKFKIMGASIGERVRLKEYTEIPDLEDILNQLTKEYGKPDMTGYIWTHMGLNSTRISTYCWGACLKSTKHNTRPHSDVKNTIVMEATCGASLVVTYKSLRHHSLPISHDTSIKFELHNTSEEFEENNRFRKLEDEKRARVIKKESNLSF